MKALGISKKLSQWKLQVSALINNYHHGFGHRDVELVTDKLHTNAFYWVIHQSPGDLGYSGGIFQHFMIKSNCYAPPDIFQDACLISMYYYRVVVMCLFSSVWMVINFRERKTILGYLLEDHLNSITCAHFQGASHGETKSRNSWRKELCPVKLHQIWGCTETKLKVKVLYKYFKINFKFKNVSLFLCFLQLGNYEGIVSEKLSVF